MIFVSVTRLIVHWTPDDAPPPSREEAGRRMRTQGRPSKVRQAA